MVQRWRCACAFQHESMLSSRGGGWGGWGGGVATSFKLQIQIPVCMSLSFLLPGNTLEYTSAGPSKRPEFHIATDKILSQIIDRLAHLSQSQWSRSLVPSNRQTVYNGSCCCPTSGIWNLEFRRMMVGIWNFVSGLWSKRHCKSSEDWNAPPHWWWWDSHWPESETMVYIETESHNARKEEAIKRIQLWYKV